MVYLYAEEEEGATTDDDDMDHTDDTPFCTISLLSIEESAALDCSVADDDRTARQQQLFPSLELPME